MKITRIITSKMRTNTYIVENGDAAFVVDPGFDAQKIFDEATKDGVKIEAILLTHAHFDHIGAVAELCKLSAQSGGDSAKVFLHKGDVALINSYKNMGFAVGVKVDEFMPDILLVGSESLKVAGLDVKVIHTPGHTEGGVCYVVGDVLFSGDTLFKGTYGRTDLYGGSFAKLKNSIINKLFNLHGDYRVLPGHGDESTLSFECALNRIRVDGDDKFDIID